MGESEHRRIGAAAFLAEALAIGDDPDALAADLLPIEEDSLVTVYAAEVDSSVGPAAFLIYAYALGVRGAAGETGQQRFDADLATLETAAARGAPGPRPVAHASADGIGFVLATSPAVLRELTGDELDGAGVANDPPPPDDPIEVRNAAANDLVALLRSADERAAAWLAAVRDSGRIDGGDRTTDAPAPFPGSFSPEETALALLLLEGGTRNLLRAFEAFLAAARDQTARGTGAEPPSG